MNRTNCQTQETGTLRIRQALTLGPNRGKLVEYTNHGEDSSEKTKQNMAFEAHGHRHLAQIPSFSDHTMTVMKTHI